MARRRRQGDGRHLGRARWEKGVDEAGERIIRVSIYIRTSFHSYCFSYSPNIDAFILSSVLERNVPEQVAHALLVVDPPDCLGEQDGDVDRFDLVALHLLQVVRDAVGHHHLVDVGLLDQAGGLLREDAVRGQRVDLVCAALLID